MLVHRLFHVPLLYKHVHKRHHEWTAPMGIVCIYATATEYLLGNVLSVSTVYDPYYLLKMDCS